MSDDLKKFIESLDTMERQAEWYYFSAVIDCKSKKNVLPPRANISVLILENIILNSKE